MPDITRVTGPWADGQVLEVEDFLKDLLHPGRVSGYDGGTAGGLEILTGQLDYTNNLGSPTITRKHVRRGAFTDGPWVAGYRQARDFWYKLFTSLAERDTPDMLEQARVVLGRSWRNGFNPSAVFMDITLDYTVASNQNFVDNTDEEVTAVYNNPITRGFIGVWVNDILVEGTATPLAAGRSSTVRPYIASDIQFYNKGTAPDFRTFSVKLRFSAGDPIFTTLVAGGWQNVSVRVSGRQTIRVHGGAIIVTPMR